MEKSEIKELEIGESQYLTAVYEYRDRTLGILFCPSVGDVSLRWERAQAELASNFQYYNKNNRIWDYYLIICCDFDEKSLLNNIRFLIENDRFCCRKTFAFNTNTANFSIENIIEDLFPSVSDSTTIELLQPKKLMTLIDAPPLLPERFMTSIYTPEEIDALSTEMIAGAE